MKNTFLKLFVLWNMASQHIWAGNREKMAEPYEKDMDWIEKKRKEPKVPWDATLATKYAPVNFKIIAGRNEEYWSHEDMLKKGEISQEKWTEMTVQRDSSGRYEVIAKGKNKSKGSVKVLKCFVPEFHMDCNLIEGMPLKAYRRNGAEYYREHPPKMRLFSSNPSNIYSVWFDVPFAPAEDWEMPPGYEWEIRFWLDEALPQLWLTCKKDDSICEYRKSDIQKMNPKIFLKPPKGMKDVYLQFRGDHTLINALVMYGGSYVDWPSGEIYYLDFTKLK